MVWRLAHHATRGSIDLVLLATAEQDHVGLGVVPLVVLPAHRLLNTKVSPLVLVEKAVLVGNGEI